MIHMAQLARVGRDRGRLHGLVLFIALALVLACLMVAMPKAYSEATIIPQAGASPLVINQDATTDITTVLTGGSSAHASTDVSFKSGPDGSFGDIVKYLGLIMPESSPADILTWNVKVASTASYDVTALVRANAGQRFQVTVSEPGGSSLSSTVFSAISTGVDDRLAAGHLRLPAGFSTITLRRIGTVSGEAIVRSIELLPDSQLTAYDAAVAAARAAAAPKLIKFSKSGYGLFYEYGAWGFPDNPGPAKSPTQQAQDFNVDAFVNMVKQTGAGYVIWTMDWFTHQTDKQMDSTNAIMGQQYTSTYDLITKVATALHASGIMFMLYYQDGSADPNWWPHAKYPSTFWQTGLGDRSNFFENWTAEISEMGQKLGPLLDGWWFDDGTEYYPAPFQAMEQTARIGNPERLVSWNPNVHSSPSVTDFQDVSFGEGSTGAVETGSAPVGGDGIFTTGPYKGLLQSGMFLMENDAGNHTKGQKIVSNGKWTSAKLISTVESAMSRNVPVSAMLMMYEDGQVGTTELAMLRALNQAVHGVSFSGPTVAINKAAGQADKVPLESTITYAVKFSEPVQGFAANDVHLSGAAIPSTAVVTGEGANYIVRVNGMKASGDVEASIMAGAATPVGDPTRSSAESTSTDNKVIVTGQAHLASVQEESQRHFH